ncbi:type II secretion system protein N [Thiomicrospira microaerophila]|uniref:type II secretion system protein N n=1 Tax=Thiomicrospira microaerophila TaxID=406020 RepID=UPI0005C8C97E|nr:type II secretion system protein N [Thiomicrospira microaerophila]
MKLVRWISGAMLLLLVFMAGFVSQVPVSYVLTQFGDQIPAELRVTQPKGTLWQGQVAMAYQGAGFEQLAEKLGGELSWQLKPSDLVLGAIKQSLPMEMQLRHGQDQLDLRLVATPAQLRLHIPQGQLDIARLAAPFAEQQFLLRGLTGQLHLRDLMIKMDYNQAWLEDASGRVIVTDLNLMGAQIEQLNIEALMQEKTIALQINAEQDGWQLQGTSRLNPPNQFDNQFELTTQQPNRFPDWALMTMQQISPTQARAEMRGQW